MRWRCMIVASNFGRCENVIRGPPIVGSRNISGKWDSME